jgi:hypothetical protein
MSRRDQLFETITAEGALLPSDFLQRLAQRDPDIKGLTPDDYHLGGGEKINEAISRSWNRVLGVWKGFSAAAQALPTNDMGTTLTRDKWLRPLFQELGYGWLATAKPFEFADRKYAISHGWQATPIHLVSFRADLDERSEAIVGARKSTPHSMVQEFLNRSDAHLWGIVSNGYRLRLLRDNASLIRQAYIEFDLQAMMQSEVYADFALLWLLLHQSRVEGERPELCWLEKWTQEARQQGERVLDHMRIGVQDAITALGQGFLAHPANTGLRQLLRDGQLPSLEYYKQLLRVVYRFIFLFIAEDRDLLNAPGVAPKTRENYRRHYSLTRLRRMAQRVGGTQHSDLWHMVRLVVTSLGAKDGCAALGLPALGSFLWSARATSALNDCQISNRYLLQAIRSLAITQQGRFRRPVDYKNIGSPEFGSVYESLLEQHPRINLDAATFTLDTHAGSERKTTGSHYTPPPLVNCLLDSALEPVLRERERDFAKLCFKSAEEAILTLKVCDKAAGSGHFLVAAAHRIAKRLASIRTGEAEPPPAALRHALRDVIGRCLYGVDINPMAVELCKFALWLEALEPGKPLSFLDHHIQCGNSLLGATPALMAQGIPDAAFEPIEGDDKKYCSRFKKANREEAEGQLMLTAKLFKPWELLGSLATGIAQITSLPDDHLEDVQAKEQKYAELVHSTGYEFGRQLSDAWCAAFVWKKCATAAGGFDYPITNEVFRRLERNPHDAPKWLRDEIKRLAEQYQFFHWHLAFPEVYQVPPAGRQPENELCGWNGGFDVILGNPPWERVKLQEKEWFAQRRPDIANATNAANRRRLIETLKTEDPALYRQFLDDSRKAEGETQLLRNSGLFPLCGRGDINLYAVFAELMRNHLTASGLVGCVLPSGVATDDTTKFFFQELVEKKSLVSLLDFENREGIFPAVHRSQKFCLFAVGSQAREAAQAAEFVFFAHRVEDLRDTERQFTLDAAEIALLNPTTRTCPIFRSKRDAELTKAMYRRTSLLQASGSNWAFKLGTLFHSSNDADKFEDADTLIKVGWVQDINGQFKNGAETAVPLYEGKMFGIYDHRAATVVLSHDALVRQRQSADTTLEQHLDPYFAVRPFFWVRANHVEQEDRWSWILCFKKVTSPTNERTLITSVLPACAANDSIHLLFPKAGASAGSFACLLGNISSVVADYTGRQKLGGVNFNFFVFEQLPLLPPATYGQPCPWTSASLALQSWLLPRVLELTYTAWDLEAFARDCGYDGPPFRWDEARRFLLRCELDAAFFHLYGINRDDTAYILDTFPVVKRKDIAAHGTYRTQETILRIYDALAEAQRTGKPYQTLLDPPPAGPAVAHPPKR